MQRVVIDIESNGLLGDLINYTALPYKLKPIAKLWCVCLRDVDTGESHTLTENFREQLKTLLSTCTELIGHNILKFDLVFLRLIGALDYTVGYPAMDGLEGTETTVFGKPVKLIDTLLWSRLFHPDRYGGHSLDAWGERLGVRKTDYRGELVKAGLMMGDEPKGFEFSFANDIMLRYCEQDTVVTVGVYNKLLKDWQDDCWDKAYFMEAKLADLAIRRETFGFAFDKDLALKNLQELDTLLKECQEKVEPNLPPMPLNKGQQDWYTPPVKQFLKSGKPNSNIHKWAAKHGGTVDDDSCTVTVYGETYQLPLPVEPIVKAIPATIDNGDWVKQCLLNLGWIPLEWKERDLTKDSKKQPLDYQKRVEALDRWWEETLNGKFKEARESELGMPLTKKTYDKLLSKLSEKWPVRVPTSPCVRIGVEKKLCDNLVKLGEKVAFAQDFAHYLTYKHRKSAIAGGKIDEIDLDEEAPPTGYLSMLREDGRVSTPAIEVGASTNRYKHIGVANVPRASSLFGAPMRGLFGCGGGGYQFGFDFSSLEARIQGHYIWIYGGEELAEQLLAPKPNSIHCINARKLNITRDNAKSITYAILYGSGAKKVAKMLGISVDEAQKLIDAFWDSMLPLKMLRDKVVEYWISTGKKYIKGIDGRKLYARSEHSLLNLLFQGGGVICAKYTTVAWFNLMERQGLQVDCFAGDVDVCGMIEMHDEAQAFAKKNLISFKTFDTKEAAEEAAAKDVNASSVGHAKKWYYCPENTVSKCLMESLNILQKNLALNVPLGVEWIVGRNWLECH